MHDETDTENLYWEDDFFDGSNKGSKGIHDEDENPYGFHVAEEDEDENPIIPPVDDVDLPDDDFKGVSALVTEEEEVE